MMELKYLILLCGFAFVIFLVFKEINRNDKSRLAWRLLASIVMVLSFILLLFPIRYTIKKKELVHELNLLTEGSSFDSLKRTPYTDPANLAYHLKAHPAIKKINIYGYGLADQDLKMLKGYQVSFHPATIPSGIISANWQKKLAISEALVIQGSFYNSTKKQMKLKLYGMGAGLDSVTVKAQTKVNFSFNTQPQQVGRAVFNLMALQGKDTVAVEPVPFEVTKRQPINVLILASFPDFEYKFLKQWLYENQYPIAFRSRISKDKFSTDFLNRKPVNMNRLNETLLKDFDVVVIDENELSGKLPINHAVNNGMGLVIRATKGDADGQPLFTDSAGKVVATRKLSGMGMIVKTTLSATYQWQLAGNKDQYTRFWSLALSSASRKKDAVQSFEIIPKWPSVNEKSTLRVSLSDYKPPVVLIDSVLVSQRQNMELPFLWDGYFWPEKPGWATISINNKIAYTYIYREADWKAAKNFDKLNSTLNFEANQPHSELRSDKVEYLATEEINKWWFLISFMLSISFLWYEQRFLANETKML